MGRDCSKCASLQTNSYAKYDCAFCGLSSQCVYADTCSSGLLSSCPPPTITDIQPLSSPLEGGTRITITGSNLGSSVDDVRRAVEVGGQPCVLVEDKYEVSQR